MSYGDILKISVRNQNTMSRSILGENQIMIDQFFDGKENEQVITVYSDAEQLNKAGEVRVKFLMRLGPQAPAGAGAAAESGASEAQEKLAAAKQTMSVETAEAVEALKSVTFTGGWTARFEFHVVDLGDGSADMSSYKAAGAGGAKGGAMLKKSDVKPGCKAKVQCQLTKKGGSYFKGTSEEFMPFGKEGNITGSLQRMSGKVNMQMQLVNTTGVTTSFNLVGLVTKDKVCQGTFSGCEISRNAGSVSGTFQMWPEGVEEPAESMPPPADAAPTEEAAAAADGGQ